MTANDPAGPDGLHLRAAADPADVGPEPLLRHPAIEVTTIPISDTDPLARLLDAAMREITRAQEAS